MANSVTTSIVVQFTKGSADGILIVEVDDRDVSEGGLNGGKTSFLPGDTVNLLLYKGALVSLDAVISSLGSLAAGASATVSKTEDVTFANETEATVRYPISGGFTYEWLGASNGAVSVIGENTLRIPAPATGQIAVGIARVTYNTTATVYRLQHSDPGYAEYGIVAFFSGSTP